MASATAARCRWLLAATVLAAAAACAAGDSTQLYAQFISYETSECSGLPMPAPPPMEIGDCAINAYGEAQIAKLSTTSTGEQQVSFGAGPACNSTDPSDFPVSVTCEVGDCCTLELPDNTVMGVSFNLTTEAPPQEDPEPWTLEEVDAYIAYLQYSCNASHAEEGDCDTSPYCEWYDDPGLCGVSQDTMDTYYSMVPAPAENATEAAEAEEYEALHNLTVHCDDLAGEDACNADATCAWLQDETGGFLCVPNTAAEPDEDAAPPPPLDPNSDEAKAERMSQISEQCAEHDAQAACDGSDDCSWAEDESQPGTFLCGVSAAAFAEIYPEEAEAPPAPISEEDEQANALAAKSQECAQSTGADACGAADGCEWGLLDGEAGEGVCAVSEAFEAQLTGQPLAPPPASQPPQGQDDGYAQLSALSAVCAAYSTEDACGAHESCAWGIDEDTDSGLCGVSAAAYAQLVPPSEGDEPASPPPQTSEQSERDAAYTQLSKLSGECDGYKAVEPCDGAEDCEWGEVSTGGGLCAVSAAAVARLTPWDVAPPPPATHDELYSELSEVSKQCDAFSDEASCNAHANCAWGVEETTGEGLCAVSLDASVQQELQKATAPPPAEGVAYAEVAALSEKHCDHRTTEAECLANPLCGWGKDLRRGRGVCGLHTNVTDAVLAGTYRTPPPPSPPPPSTMELEFDVVLKGVAESEFDGLKPKLEAAFLKSLETQHPGLDLSAVRVEAVLESAGRRRLREEEVPDAEPELRVKMLVHTPLAVLGDVQAAARGALEDGGVQAALEEQGVQAVRLSAAPLGEEAPGGSSAGFAVPQWAFGVMLMVAGVAVGGVASYGAYTAYVRHRRAEARARVAGRRRRMGTMDRSTSRDPRREMPRRPSQSQKEEANDAVEPLMTDSDGEGAGAEAPVTPRELVGSSDTLANPLFKGVSAAAGAANRWLKAKDAVVEQLSAEEELQKHIRTKMRKVVRASLHHERFSHLAEEAARTQNATSFDELSKLGEVPEGEEWEEEEEG